jgi:hypothetical protein
VSSIAKGLLLTQAAGTKEIFLTFFKFNFKRASRVSVRISHQKSPLLFNLADEGALDKIDSSVALFIKKGIIHG